MVGIERRCPTTGKRCLSYKEANAAAKRARRKHHEPRQAYRCPDCRCWHTGNRHV